MFIKVVDDQQILAVAQLAAEIWTEHYTPIIGSEQVEYMLNKFQTPQAIAQQISQGYSYYLVQDNDNYVGYFGVQPKIDELFLSKLYVKSSCRGQGHGRQILNFVENLARHASQHKITLAVNKKNTRSIRIYHKLGFKNVGPAVTDIGNGFVMDDFIMQKTLE